MHRLHSAEEQREKGDFIPKMIQIVAITRSYKKRIATRRGHQKGPPPRPKDQLRTSIYPEIDNKLWSFVPDPNRSSIIN